MSKTNSYKDRYKYCLVPCCTSTTISTKEKIFFHVPKDSVKRKAWIYAMRRDEKLPPKLSTNSTLWCCEDHFSLPDDMENYWRFKLTKDVKRMRLKSGVIPHIFNCQKKHVPAEAAGMCTSLEKKNKTVMDIKKEIDKCSVHSEIFSAIEQLSIHYPGHIKDEPQELNIRLKNSGSKSGLETGNFIQSQDEPHELKITQENFVQENELDKHLKTRDIYQKCSICSKIISSKSNLSKHLLLHTKRKTYGCSICHKYFATKYYLNIHHYRVHIKEKPYECSICNKSFATMAYLKKHYRVHTREKPSQCDICLKRFRDGTALTRHSVTHTNEKLHECGICHKRFALKHSLKPHQLIHSKEKSHECSICHRYFARKFYLNVHYLVHTKEKPYECSTCNKKFASMEYLKRHYRHHTKEKPYKCNICLKGFVDKRTLTKHSVVHSKKKKPHECSICHKYFSRKYNLNVHYRVHTKEEINKN